MFASGASIRQDHPEGRGDVFNAVRARGDTCARKPHGNATQPAAAVVEETRGRVPGLGHSRRRSAVVLIPACL